MLAKTKYNELNGNELKEIVQRLSDEASECMEILDFEQDKIKADKTKIEIIQIKYSNIKTELKEIYHFINLEANQSYVDKWYPVFKEAITNMYVHADARINTSNTRDLYSTLYDIKDYAGYALGYNGFASPTRSKP